VEQLKEIIGKHNRIDFEGLGLIFDEDELAVDDELTEEDSEINDAEELLEGENEEENTDA
jgi:hypothetical protein